MTGSGRQYSCWPGRCSTLRLSRCCAGLRFRRRCRLCLFAAVIMLSQLKFSILWMVINFFDVLIIDSDTVAFLLSIFPDLRIMARDRRPDRRSGAGADLADRSVPDAAVRGAARGSRVFDCDHCLGACGAGRALGAVPGHQSRLDLRSLRRDHGLRADAPRAGSISIPRPRISFAPRQTSRAVRPASRRTSSWCSTRRASMPACFPASSCRRVMASISVRSTARRARCLSRGRAVRPGTPNTTC